MNIQANNKEANKPMRLAKGPKYVREKLQGKAFLIPSCITVTGIFCGFLGIISAFRGHYEYATKCIGLAIILDGLDGRVARKLNATSAFGREFDSLADMIAFGVAPAVLVYSWAFSPMVDEFGLLVAFVFVVCGATRLARFNIAAEAEGAKASSHFVGLPIPGAAAAIASIIYFHPEPVADMRAIVALVFYVLIVAFLMVSTLPFLSVKQVNLTHGNPARNLVLLSLTIALIWKYSQIAILVLSTAYAWSGPVMFLASKRWGASKEEGE